MHISDKRIIKRFESRSKKPNNELLGVLQKQRLQVDENAIHFVAEARPGTRADARNSVFKLAQRYKAIPDKEHGLRIKQLFGKVGGEDDDSGDEEWEPSFRRMPAPLKERSNIRLLSQMQQNMQEHLLCEMNNIESESASLSGVVTHEDIPLQPLQSQLGELASSEAEEDVDEDEEELNDEDFTRLNTMQREFIGNNLQSWFTDIKQAYETGVKLVKVNALGHKFIRMIEIKDLFLNVLQPHSLSNAKVNRSVSLVEITKVSLGNDSKEFRALEELAKQMPGNSAPKATQCAVVHLPNSRSLSLIFIMEDNRNAFVFYLRVIIKRLKSAQSELEK